MTPRTLVLTLGLGPDGATALLQDGRRLPVEGSVGADALVAAARVDHDPPAVLSPRAAAALSAAERDTAVALAGALLDPPGMAAVRDRLHGWAARHAGEMRTVVLDLRLPVLRGLPWEILGALRPGRSPLAGVHWVRGVPGPAQAAPPTGAHLEVLLWVPDPEDPICAAVASHLQDRLRRAGPEASCVRIPDPLRAPAARPGVSRILHLVTHGQPALDQLVLSAAGGRVQATDALARLVEPLLRQLHLAVIDVCGGASTVLDPAEAPASRFVAAGVPAALGPRSDLDPFASQAFTGALYDSLLRGQGVLAAVRAARAAMDAAGLAHRSARSWNVTVSAADLAWQQAPPPLETFQLPGTWALGTLPACRAGATALAVAWERGLGFVGLEHVALALSRSASPHLDRPVREAFGRLGGLLDELAPEGPAEPGPPRETEGLRRVLAELGAGHDLAALAVAVLTAPLAEVLLGQDDGVRRWLGRHGTETVAPGTGAGSQDPHMTTAPPTGLLLVALGGPDDGRRIHLGEPGAQLGRATGAAGEDPATRLFAGWPVKDVTVSRRHLTWLGRGRLKASGGYTEVDGEALSPGQECLLRPGQVLKVGSRQRLWVVGCGG